MTNEEYKKLNKQLHGLLNQLNLMKVKGDLVYGITQGRTTSSAEMSENEIRTLINSLKEDKESRVKKMRGKIIHYLCLYGMTTPEGDPDYDRIERFVKNIGSRNPNKRNLFTMNPKEMRDVLNQIERMMKKEYSNK